jgi:Cdc6-like AAA superfamily ATPase
MSLESLLVHALNSARKSSPPLPAGLHLGAAQSLIGNERGPFSLPCTPPQHTFISGRTGSGKTTALLKIMSELHRKQIPFFFIDLHGQATGELLALLAAREGQA